MNQANFWHDPAVAEAYAQLTSNPIDAWYAREVNRPLVASLIPPSTERVLDVGCGPGVSTAKLAETFPEVDGTDTSEPMLAVARKLYPNLKFFSWEDDISPEQTETYDSIVCA